MDLLAGLVFRSEVSIMQEKHSEYGDHDAESGCHACRQVVVVGGLVKLLVPNKLDN